MRRKVSELTKGNKIAIFGLAVAIIGVLIRVWYGSGTDINTSGDAIQVDNDSGTTMINTGSGDQTNIQIPQMYDLKQFQEQAAEVHPELKRQFDHQEYTMQDRKLMAGFRSESHEFSVGCRKDKMRLTQSECDEFFANMTDLYVDRVRLFDANRHLMDQLDARGKCLYIRGFWREFENQWNLARPIQLDC